MTKTPEEIDFEFKKEQFTQLHWNCRACQHRLLLLSLAAPAGIGALFWNLNANNAIPSAIAAIIIGVGGFGLLKNNVEDMRYYSSVIDEIEKSMNFNVSRSLNYTDIEIDGRSNQNYNIGLVVGLLSFAFLALFFIAAFALIVGEWF